MSLRRPLTTVVVAAALGSAVLSGCSVAGTGAQPGAAARVGDETISMERVDDVADSLCEVLLSDARQEAQVYPGSVLRNAAHTGLVMREMGEQILEEHGAEVPDGAVSDLDRLRRTYGSADPEDLETALPAFVGGEYLQAVFVAVGREELGEEATDEQALTAGVELARAWQDEQDLETNPALDAVRIGETSFETERDAVSVAVSDAARDATDPESGAERAASLPASQTCRAED